MGFLAGSAPTFRRSPLSLAVPLEGTDTAAGLRTLERMQLRERLLSNGAASPAQTSAASTTAKAPSATAGRRRYTGRRAVELTVDDLKAEPRHWSTFLYNGPGGRLASAYDVPPSLAALADRAEENVVYYLPNYLRILAGSLLMMLYSRPFALLAVLCMALTGGASLIAAGPPPPPGSWEARAAMAAPYLGFATSLLLIASRALSLLLRWAATFGALVALHACARLAQSEHRRGAAAGAGGGGRLLARLSFRRQGAQAPPPPPDRLALFREIATLLHASARDAALHGWAALQYTWLHGWDRLQYRGARLQ